MAFDLTIEFAGLCLLVRKPGELLVLLPDTSAHPSHRHAAVLGSEQIYQRGSSFPPCESFIDHSLDGGNQTISFAGLTSNHTLNTDTIIDPSYRVVDISDCARAPNPAKAYAQVVLRHGSACPIIECTHDTGAIWHFPHRPRSEPMATKLAWKAEGVTNKLADNTEGLQFTVKVQGGRVRTVTFRPEGGELRLYVYNTLPDEVPCVPKPKPHELQVGDDAPHFNHYFDLFDATTSCKPPRFVSDGTSTFRKAFFGRRYTCILATTTG